ncbi:MAG: hypothetical protein WBL45_05860 [Solirubrobacterales bacterium]
MPAVVSAALVHPFLGAFGGSEQPTFAEAQGLAVDQSNGDLLVIDAGNRGAGEGTVSRWNPDGTPANFSALGTNVIEGLSFTFPEGAQVAVDNSGGPTDGNIYVNQEGLAVVEIFDKDGNSLGELSGYEEGSNAEGPPAAFGAGAICGVAVDPAGNVYVGDFFQGVHKYEPSSNPPENTDNSANFPFESGCALAAGAGPTDGFLFPSQLNFAGGDVAKLDSTDGEQKYSVHPGPTTTVSVDPGTGNVFVASGSEVREYDASGPTEAVPLVPIAPGGEQVTGIAVNEASGNIYLSRASSPTIEVWGPGGVFPGAITEAATVLSGTVILHGVVNPDEGPPATCAFEYVEINAKGFAGATSVPCSPAGPFSGSSGFQVSAQITGLAEGAYRFRLVASNENGPNPGDEQIFETFEQLPGLPDGRAYEMVSPPQKAGEVVPPEPTGFLGGSCGNCLPGENTPSMPMQSAPDGESILYLGQPFFAGLAAEPSDYIGIRTAAGWETEGLSSTATTGKYQAFSTAFSRGVLFQIEPPLSPQAPTRGGKAFGNLYLQEGGTLQPLVTEEPPNRNPREPGEFRIRFATANAGTPLQPAFEHLVFEANDALTKAIPGVAPAAPEVEAVENRECTDAGVDCNLYERIGGQLRLVNVLPDNENAASNAVIGAGQLLAPLKSPAVDHAISDDGARIFWSSEETGEVYVRVNGTETLEIPGPGSCIESEPLDDRACFLAATSDGTAVLLSDGRIYELNEEEDEYEAGPDLTLDESEVHQGGFQGILGAAEDLSRVYFVDTAALTEESVENANGEHAEGGEFNLYVWDEGASAFIGVLSPKDLEFNGLYGAWLPSPSDRIAQVSPDGRFLAFTSVASLTGYDNGLRGGEGCVKESTSCQLEVFEYSAGAESLSCASCNPSGQQPLGGSNLSLIRPEGPFPQPANLSPEGEGRLFFESRDALVPRDTNGKIQDIYEWEPNGVGSCKRAGGCVYLVSSGHSSNDSMFVDSSASGDDAFFITREQLLPLDQNQQLDLYDARVSGGFPEPSPSPCGGDGCAGPIASPPAESSVDTESSGPGNPPPPKAKPKPCKRGFVKKKGKCVKKKSKKHRRGGSK